MITGTALGAVKIRTGPGTTFPETGEYLQKGDTIEASENQAQWLHLTKINGVAVQGTKWASAGMNEQYINWSEVPDPGPGPDPEPEPNPDDIVEILSSTVTYRTASGETKTATLRPVP